MYYYLIVKFTLQRLGEQHVPIPVYSDSFVRGYNNTHIVFI